MSEFEKEDGVGRADLLQRLELMECMIAEGRESTMRNGWIFVLWGLVDCVGMGWENFWPHSRFAGHWAWPICLSVGAVITVVGKMLQGRQPGKSKNAQCRSVEAVWAMMGVGMALYVGTEIATHLAWQYSYVAGMMMMLGTAHATSALILRWRAQGLVAAAWWAGGVGILAFKTSQATMNIFLAEMCVGMVLFGLYVMMLEQQRKAGRTHA